MKLSIILFTIMMFCGSMFSPSHKACSKGVISKYFKKGKLVKKVIMDMGFTIYGDGIKSSNWIYDNKSFECDSIIVYSINRE